ncbi:MAG TPA: UDP-N-acetylmuramoyl-tripeptide--D-alanyl-D-alanine ligase [Acidimicrobiales bacterium]|nr:UDP-N-acetylmuramoyl-tripeptide--D-alanyl-D-alanine ligase [Acidimicrobiales bacterium]
MELSTNEIAKATGGVVSGPDVGVSGATIDSRHVARGQLFVPVVAARDGHDFVADAIAAGAAAYLTSRGPLDGVDATAVEVDDTVAALGAVGRHARTRLPDRVVGITGSVGKTSVKDLLAVALAARWRTSSSVGSFNNELGVPLTLVNAAGDTEALVVELGARGLGHIAALCALAAPTVGVVTRVAAVHTETFGTLEEVASAKGELVEALPDNGHAVLNAGDPLVVAMASRTSAEIVTFGGGGDVRAESVALDDELRPSFRLVSPWGTAAVRLGVRGEHMIDNALAAASAALVCHVSLDAVAAALETAVLSRWRMDLVRLGSGALVVNDAYNANPTSMAAALRSLVRLPARRRVAVLGLMAELGSSSDDEHRAVGATARELGVEVIGVGVPAYGGTTVGGVAEVPAALGPLGDGDAVLLKGSRVAGLERLMALLESTG